MSGSLRKRRRKLRIMCHGRPRRVHEWVRTHYNKMNQGGEHELVIAVVSNCFIFNGVWTHANFLAKRKGATSCVDLVPKYFFAELKRGRDGLSCVSCVKMGPGDPKGGCGVCPSQILHPAAGGYRNARLQPIHHAAGGLQVSFSF